jgi:hypothetical protein
MTEKLLWGLGAIGSACLTYDGVQRGKNFQTIKDAIIDNISDLTSDNLSKIKRGKRGIFSIKITKECGILDIYEQGILNYNVAQPVNNIGVGLSYDSKQELIPVITTSVGTNIINKQRIGFIHYKRLLSNDNFNSNILVQKKNMNIASSMDFTMTDEFVKSGSEMNETITERFGNDISLKSDKIYKLKYYSLKNKTIYFSGIRVGDVLIYDAFSTDPLILINAIQDYSILQKVAGVCVGVVCGFNLTGIMSKL